MIKKPNEKRIAKMKQSRKIFIMDKHGNILTSAREISKAIKEDKQNNKCN